MKIQDLADIAAICELGSFRKAALKLGIAQPTLSHRIAHVEQELGTLLFERSQGRSRPTATAIFIAERAHDIVNQSDQLIAQINRVARGKSGKVRLGFGPAPAHAFLTEILRLSREKAPGPMIETSIGSTYQLADLMLRGKIDLAVCPMDPELFNKPVDAELVLEEKLVIAARPDHPVFSERLKKPTDFFKYELVLPVLEPRYITMAKLFYGTDLTQLDNTIYCSDYVVLINLVKSGKFITAGPRFAFLEEIKRGELKAFTMDKRISHPVHIITNKRSLAFPALEVVISSTRQTIKKLTG
jgi:DNA-binding transcriptional LysR family regulator